MATAYSPIAFWHLAALSLACLGAGCAAPPSAPDGLPQLSALLPTDLLLLGEQHDAREHQQWERATVQWLAGRGRLAAVVIEMAETGRSTEGLPASATEAQARQALGWSDAAWPWASYGPVVMAAVRAGVPVRGGDLPRQDQRAALQDTAFDAHLPAPALERQYAALRAGHCGLLPESQIAPMARVQLARDASLARAARQAMQAMHPGQTVVLVAGMGHARRDLGVPTWLPAGLNYKVAIAQAGQPMDAIEKEADLIHATPALPAHDPCEELRARWHPAPGARPAAAPAAAP